jgi:hypothetical protein
MSHPDPDAAPDLTPIRLGEVWENPFTGERATIRELPFTIRKVARARAAGPVRRAPSGSTAIRIERLTVVGGELTEDRRETNTAREAGRPSSSRTSGTTWNATLPGAGTRTGHPRASGSRT